MIAPDDPRRAGRKRPRGQYSHKEKLVTVVAAETYGVKEVSRRFGVSPQSVRAWKSDEELLPYVLGARRQIMGDVTASAEKAWAETLRRLNDDATGIPTRELLAIAAEATSKMQLLGGGATSRSEVRDITEGVTEAEMKVVVDAARRHLARHGPSARAAMAANGRLALPAQIEPDPA